MYRQWTTQHEKDYVKEIGSFTIAKEGRSLNRKIQFLKNYLAAANLRSDWGEIDKSEVLSYARQRLMQLEMRVG